VYLNDAQFPADGKYQGNYLWNNIGSTSGTSSANRGLNATNPPHNFAYTYELHLMFVYHSGQVFTFKGDDDVYVFMNKLLVIDLGGVHSSISKTITLNSSTKATDGVTALNLVEGQAYQFDFFYCERHTTESHMQISTTIPLNDSIIPN
jgi:fibro-slime domain-containing protein